MRNFQSGKYIDQGYYKSFEPEPINRQWGMDDMEVLHLLDKANREIGRLDMYSEYIPNIDLFIHMHVLREATQSSRIEGTRTNVEEALLNVEELPAEKRDDWQEVQNYVRAMSQAMEGLKTLPFSSRLLRQVHKTLMTGVRGDGKQPGEYRKSQNWIGGSSISDAVFVPPTHTSIPALMSDLEKFVHNDGIYFPELLRIALIHYQFETIHPFLDGNGRIGRLMITLYLVSKGILKRPVLYFSDFLERNRTLYYDNLMHVRQKNDMGQWFRFFLAGMTETAQKGIRTFDNILRLQKECDASIQAMGSRAGNAKKVVDKLYTRPIITAAEVKSICDISAPSAYTLIAALEAAGILREVTGGKRGRVYYLDKYLDLFKV